MARPTARKPSFRYLIEAIGGYGIVFLLRLLPLKAASAVGGWLGRTIGPRAKVSRRATDNLKMVFPEKSDAEIARIVRGVWDNLGRTGCEYPHLKRLWEPDLFDKIAKIGFGRVMAAADAGKPITIHGRRLEVVGVEHAVDFYFDPRARIIFSGHFGNWEIMPLFANNIGMSVDVIYRRPNNPYVDKLLADLRSGHGGLVPKGLLGAVASRRVLDRGGLLGLLADQKHNQGVSVPFFDRPAMTAALVAKLALQYRCPVHGAWVRRLGGVRFRLEITPPLEIPDSGDAEADVLAILKQVNQTFERWIRESPEQWMWMHRRWPKKKPNEAK